jgi:hypothetical protein
MGFFMHVRLEGALDSMFNFRTFQNSFLVLFQISTAAGWDGILDGVASEKEDCELPDPDLEKPGNCGHFGTGVFYIVSYLLICSYLILSTMIAIVFANHRQAIKDAEQQGITDEDFDQFYQKWAQFSPDGSEYIRHDQLQEFLGTLDSPFQISPDKAMDIPISDGDKASSTDVLDVLIKNFFAPKGAIVEEIEMEEQTREDLNTEAPSMAEPKKEEPKDDEENEGPEEIVEES